MVEVTDEMITTSHEEATNNTGVTEVGATSKVDMVDIETTNNSGNIEGATGAGGIPRWIYDRF